MVVIGGLTWHGVDDYLPARALPELRAVAVESTFASARWVGQNRAAHVARLDASFSAAAAATTS